MPNVVPARQIDGLGNCVGNADQAAGATQLRLLAVDQIQQGKGQVAWIALEGGGRGLAGPLGCLGKAALRCQGAQTVQLTVGNDSRGRLIGGAEDSVRQVLVVT